MSPNRTSGVVSQAPCSGQGPSSAPVRTGGLRCAPIHRLPRRETGPLQELPSRWRCHDSTTGARLRNVDIAGVGDGSVGQLVGEVGAGGLRVIQPRVGLRKAQRVPSVAPRASPQGRASLRRREPRRPRCWCRGRRGRSRCARAGTTGCRQKWSVEPDSGLSAVRGRGRLSHAFGRDQCRLPNAMVKTADMTFQRVLAACGCPLSMSVDSDGTA